MTKPSRLLIVLGLIALATLSFAGPAMADVAALQDSDLVPAEPVEEATEEEDEQPWTARYLIPTLIVATIVLIVGLALYYFIAIKNRYTVVQS